MRTEVTYIGSVINKEGRRPDILQMHIQKSKETPKTVRQLKSWLRYINWFRPY